MKGNCKEECVGDGFEIEYKWDIYREEAPLIMNTVIVIKYNWVTALEDKTLVVPLKGSIPHRGVNKGGGDKGGNPPIFCQNVSY